MYCIIMHTKCILFPQQMLTLCLLTDILYTYHTSIEYLRRMFFFSSKSGYMCTMFYRRDTHVAEIQMGSAASSVENACASDHFDINKLPYITLLGKCLLFQFMFCTLAIVSDRRILFVCLTSTVIEIRCYKLKNKSLEHVFLFCFAASKPDAEVCPKTGIYSLKGAIGPPYISSRHKRNHSNRVHNHSHHHHDGGGGAANTGHRK